MTTFLIIVGIIAVIVLIIRAMNNAKKPQKNNELRELATKLHKEVFPNGETDIKAGISELLRILNNSIDTKTAIDIFTKSSYICYTTTTMGGGQFNKERLRQHLAPYALKYFNEKTLDEFYNLLLSKNKNAALFDIAKKFAQQSNPNGTDQDEMPEGYGEFGLEITNPIPAASIPESYLYLQSLRTISGANVTFERIGSMRAPNIQVSVDGYKIFCNGSQIATIYICAYNNRTSKKAPKGFMLNGQTENNKSNIKEPTIQPVSVKKEIIHGKKCILITVSIEDDNIPILGIISEIYPNMIENRSYRDKNFSVPKGNIMYASQMQAYIDNITFLSDYLDKNGMTDENLEEALYLLCKKHIIKNNRMIDNDLYGIIDDVIVLKCALVLYYKQQISDQQLELQWLQLLQSCLPRIKDNVYITKYDLSNPLQPRPYLEKMI